MTAFHEAVFLYAIALNEAISEGYYITNGTIITQKMWNRTFEGMSHSHRSVFDMAIKSTLSDQFYLLGITGNVSIDENGDRNLDYSILDMNPLTGNFEVVANYYGVRFASFNKYKMMTCHFSCFLSSSQRGQLWTWPENVSIGQAGEMNRRQTLRTVGSMVPSVLKKVLDQCLCVEHTINGP